MPSDTIQDAKLDTLFGYPIPMPKSDLLIALATVVSFLPVFVIVYRTSAWISNTARSLVARR